MPKLTRKTVVQFGAGGPSTDFGQFGSEKAGTPQTSQDPSIIQQLSAWATGWAAAAVGAAFNPYLEDLNGFCFTVFYFLANLFERGIPDWDAGTTYYKGAYVQDPAGSGQRWYSLQDNNLNNAPPASASNAFWQWDNAPQNPPGTLHEFTGIVVPVGFLWAMGQALSRTVYATLFNAITFLTVGTTTSGSKVITGIPDTSNLQAGFYLEGTGIATGAQVQSVDSPTQITMTVNALSSNVGTALRFSPWALGDGATTFNIVDTRRRVGVGAGGVGTATLGSNPGATGGEEAHVLTQAESVPHTHGIVQNTVLSQNTDVIGAVGAQQTSGMNPTGAAAAHNNIQPSYVVTKIIKT